MREGSAAEHLGAELENIVRSNQRITLPEWPDGLGWEFAAPEYDDSEASQGTGGSNNWAVEALGCRYSVNFRERGWNREKEASEFFAKARRMFGGAELDSTIYAYMQAHAVLEIAHVSKLAGNANTHFAAMEWLENMAARAELFRSPRTRRVMTVGDRSAALLAPGEASWMDHFATVGMKRGMVPHEPILNARANIVRDAFAKMRDGGMTPLQVIRALRFRTLSPTRVAEWSGGKAVWRVGSRWHGSTQPVCICVEQDGHETYFPEHRGYVGDPKDKTHRRPGAPTVTEYPDELRYDSPIYESGGISIPPRSERTLDIEVGGPEIVKNLLITEMPSEPSTTSPPTSGKLASKPRRRKRFGVS